MQKQRAQAQVYRKPLQQAQWKHIWVHLTRGVNKLNDDEYRSNILQQTKQIVVDPPPQITPKAATGATAQYFNQAYAHELVDVQPPPKGPQVIQPENITMDPEQLGHLQLALPPSAT